MFKITIEDLARIEILGKNSMARIQGGMSYPVEPDGGNGGPGPTHAPKYHPPIDVDKLREEIFAQFDMLQDIPESYQGADPLGGPF